LIVAQVWFEVRYARVLPFAVAVFGFYTAVYCIYQAVSLPVNFAGRSFDVAAHKSLVDAWHPQHYPSVDIFLPICGEPIEVLRNTWIGVFELVQAYPGDAYVFVLDDGPSEEARAQASSFGFIYVRRPVMRQHKKAGNLNYAFRRTGSEHIVIFDADFRPRADFLSETLPYMDDPRIGIVQTPQFFRTNRRQTWVERAAGPTLEVFYRAVQVSRDRFGSALCVGSNAVYRRAALAPMGGFTEIPYAEDSHTGLDVRYHGYELVYIPVPLAAGICPATLDAFMRQQYRMVLRRHVAGLDEAHVACSYALDLPSALCRWLALELHHGLAHRDRAPDPGHSAHFPSRRDPSPQRIPAAARRHHQHRLVSALA
jgi:cellulose synthase (UDP-forming)